MTRRLALIATLLLTPVLGSAQPGGPGRGTGPRWGQEVTPGWMMMSPAEREQHREKILSLTTYEECRAYMDQHHQQMVERARSQGRSMPAQRLRDGCAGLPPAPKN